MTRLEFDSNSVANVMAKVLGRVLGKVAEMNQVTSSYIDDILVDESVVMAGGNCEPPEEVGADC